MQNIVIDQDPRNPRNAREAFALLMSRVAVAGALRGGSSPVDPVTTFVTEENANLTAIQTQLTTVIVPGIAALDTLITNFEANLTSTLTPADSQALAAMNAASTALLASVNAVNVTAPVAPSVKPAVKK
jgi:hypothetical protein